MHLPFPMYIMLKLMTPCHKHSFMSANCKNESIVHFHAHILSPISNLVHFHARTCTIKHFTYGILPYEHHWKHKNTSEFWLRISPKRELMTEKQPTQAYLTSISSLPCKIACWASLQRRRAEFSFHKYQGKCHMCTTKRQGAYTDKRQFHVRRL